MLRIVRNTVIPKNKLLLHVGLLLFVGLLFATPGFATVLPSCTVIPPGSGTVITAYLPGSSSLGCADGNLQFNNFSVGPVGAGGYTVASTQCGGSTCTIPMGTSTADPSTISIGMDNAIGFHMASTSVGQLTCKSSGVGDGSGFCASEHLSAPVSNVTQITFTESTVNLASSINLLGLAAALTTHSSGKSGATAIIFEEFCPGVAVFVQGCTGYGIFSIGEVQGQFQSITATNGAGFANTNQVAVRYTVWLATVGASGEWASLDSADAAVPEPATLGMVGLALAGLGALKFRRKRA